MISVFLRPFQANTPWWDSYVTAQQNWNDLTRRAFSMVPSPLGWTDEAEMFCATQRAAERLLSDAFNATQSTLPWIQKGQLMPTLDITETDQAFALRVELPGIAADDVEVSTKHGSLIVRGEKKAEQTQDNASCLRRECTYGSFERVVALPKEADLNKAEATFQKQRSRHPNSQNDQGGRNRRENPCPSGKGRSRCQHGHQDRRHTQLGPTHTWRGSVGPRQKDRVTVKA